MLEETSLGTLGLAPLRRWKGEERNARCERGVRARACCGLLRAGRSGVVAWVVPCCAAQARSASRLAALDRWITGGVQEPRRRLPLKSVDLFFDLLRRSASTCGSAAPKGFGGVGMATGPDTRGK